MPNWTKEQLDAIEKENSNIIVSAGAGSGKTAVLTERVIRKLKKGVNINELLILTFTKKAAAEMKERIRKAIKKDAGLLSQLDYIDSSYITTFDSYALSVVKKYHYLLNIPSNVAIADSSIIYIEKKKIIDNIFNELYEVGNEDFLKLVSDFTTKDDKDIKEYIISISDKLDLKYDKKEYLERYLNEYFNEKKIEKDIKQFEQILKSKIRLIDKYLTKLSNYVEIDYYNLIKDSVSSLLVANTYKEILDGIAITLPMIPKGSEEDAKTIKESITKLIKEIELLCKYRDVDEIKETIKSTYKYIRIIIEIISKLDCLLSDYKDKYNNYEFVDISKMAIKILKKHSEVKEEIKEFFYEIMIDEYQDTNDLQEEFIKMIEKNNVYLVGDIKQSIYRFRNANPYIFKNKYDNYTKNINGYKIDLNKNFRSRIEVIDNINIIFKQIMNDDLGGADYLSTHQMVFGNTSYVEKGSTNQNNDLEILNYKYDKEFGFSKEEIELFTIAKDIKHKIDNKYQVFDKDDGILRDIRYSDFAILLDRSTNFDLCKKIFEYLSIPLTKYTDTNITNEYDTYIIKNILGLIIYTKNKRFDNDFKYYFTSVARSYLFRLEDNEIFNYLIHNNYFDSIIMKSILKIVSTLESSSLVDIFNMIVSEFNFYYNFIKVGKVDNAIIRIEYLMNIVNNLASIGYTIEDLYDYLNTLIEEDYALKVSSSENNSDSVKIMTIHASKGLEFHICYFALLSSKFNISDLNEKFIFDNSIGIVSPYFNEGIGTTIYKEILKDNYIKEEISEKIRLFYVALTRSKEKIIIIASLNPEDVELTDEIKIKYRSFLDILNSVKSTLNNYIKDIDINNINLTKDYNLIKKYNYKESIKLIDNKIEQKELTIKNDNVIITHYSKEVNKLLESNDIENMEFGIKLHNALELIDFKNPNYDNIDLFIRNKIERFLNNGFDFKSAKIYKEYEFIYENNDTVSHGIIDLMLEYDNNIKIIDYKLRNVSDEAYLKQLSGYKNYIESKTNKYVEIYLYSILDEKIVSLVDIKS